MRVKNKLYFLNTALLTGILTVLYVVLGGEEGVVIWVELAFAFFSLAVYYILLAIEDAVNYLKKKEDDHVGQ